MVRSVNSAELSSISGHEVGLINQTNTGMLEQWRTKNVVAQFIGQGSSLANQATTDCIKCIKMMVDQKMRAIKSIRLKDYDYSSDGFYFITICTNYRKPYLIGRREEIVAKSIEQLACKINGVKADYYQIMPSHIHPILILEECQLRLSEIVRRLKAVTTKQVGFKLWQPNYYEHVIRGEKSLAKIRGYFQNNPLAERLL